MQLLTSLFLSVLKISLTAGIVAGIVLIVRLLIGKKLPHRVSYALWGLVLVRLLLPFSLPSPASIFNLSGYTPQYTLYQDLTPVPSPAVSFPSEQISPDTHTDNNQEQASSAAGLDGQAEEESFLPDTSGQDEQLSQPQQQLTAEPVLPSSSQTGTDNQNQPFIAAIAAVIWICGAVLLLGCGMVSWGYLYRKFRTAWLYDDQQLFDRCNQLLRHPLRRRVRLYVSPVAESPMVMGIFRPRIILPNGTFAQQQMQCMVTHELIHIRRGDQLFRLLGIGLACIHWFNPLIWLAVRFSGKDMELSCDEAALSRLGNDAPAVYAEALLDLSVRQHRMLFPLLMFGESNLKTRIKNTLSYKKPALWISATAVILLAGCGVGLLTDPIRLDQLAEEGDLLTVQLSGIPLTVTAEEQVSALLNPQNWEQLDETPTVSTTASLQIETEQAIITLSQTDPVAIVNQGTEENPELQSYTVPLGTEETLRARLLEESTEYAALPESQQQILSALVNAETIWGAREYADYFAISSDFAARFAAAILQNPGQTVEGIQPSYSEEWKEILLMLINPGGTTNLSFWTDETEAVLSMGETQVSLDPTPFVSLTKEFQSIPYTGWSTNTFNTQAPGFTELTGLPDNWQNFLIDDCLVCWGRAGESEYELRIYSLSDGELLYSEPTDYYYIDQVRKSGSALYDLEITGRATTQSSSQQTPFVWGIRLDGEVLSDYHANWPEIYTESIYYQDRTLIDNGVMAAAFDGYNLSVTQIAEDNSQQYEILTNLDDIRAMLSEQGVYTGDLEGLDNVSFSNGGRTVIADLSVTGYPFVNGLLIAAQEENSWNIRVISGSSLYDQQLLYNSFYRVLDDGTILYACLDDNGWTAELIDQNTLQTIRTLDFGSYSYEYLSLEGKYPLSISGDSFYSPRIILRMLDRDRIIVNDRSYKLDGQRIYLLDTADMTLSEPMELNGILRCWSDNWLITGNTTGSASDPLEPTDLFCRPIDELAASLQTRPLRPVPEGDKTQTAELDPVLMKVFEQPIYLTLRGGEYAAYSDTLNTNLFHPLRWTLCAEIPVLPDQPTYTAADITGRGSGYASANFYESDDRVILELLPEELSEQPAYYEALYDQQSISLSPVSPSFTLDGIPTVTEYWGRDADRQRLESQYQLELLDAAALLQTGRRQRYDDRMVNVLTFDGETAVCLVTPSADGSFIENAAATGVIPEDSKSFEAGGLTFWETDESMLFVYHMGENPIACTLTEGLSQGLIGTDTLSASQAAAAEKMPALYREETVFRVEQLLNCLRWQNEQTGDPAAMMYNAFYYQFAKQMAAYQASDEWEDWTKKVSTFLEDWDGYPDWKENLSLALQFFYPGEIFRTAITDGWGDGVSIDWEYPGNLLNWYPEEDIVEIAYGVGFETSTHLYPVALEEADGQLTVSYVTLIWYPGGMVEVATDNGQDSTPLDDSWPLRPTLAELTARADELPVQTAIFIQEDGRWIFAP